MSTFAVIEEIMPMYNDPFLRWSRIKVNPRKGLRDLPSFDYTLDNANEKLKNRM